MGRADEAPWIYGVRGTRWRLGRDHHGPDGDARGIRSRSAFIPTCRACFNPILTRLPFRARRPRPVSPADDKVAYELSAFVYAKGIGYGYQMGLRPQALYGIAESPVGIAGYLLDHDASMAIISRAFDGQPEGLTRDDVLDNVTLTWLTNMFVSGPRLYWECFEKKTRSSVSKVSPIRSSSTTTSFDGHFAAWGAAKALRGRNTRRILVAAPLMKWKWRLVEIICDFQTAKSR